MAASFGDGVELGLTPAATPVTPTPGSVELSTTPAATPATPTRTTLPGVTTAAAAGRSAREIVKQRHSLLAVEQEAPLPRPGFYYLGVITLLGWNMILAFTHALDVGMFGGRTWAGSGWAFWCAMCHSALVNLVQGALSSRRIGEAIPVATQLIAGCLLSTISLSGMMILRLTAPPTAAPAAGSALAAGAASGGGDAVDSTFRAALGLICVQGTSSALLNSAVFALAGSIDNKITMDAMVGQGLGGCLAAFVGLAASDSESGLAASFALSAATCLAGVPVYLCWVKENHHLRSQGTPSGECPAPDRLQASSAGDGVAQRASACGILRRAAWPQCLTVCFVFVVTFLVFPGVTSRWRGGHFATLIATFQLVDVVGRFAPQLDLLHLRSGRLVSSFSAVRALFVPAFIFVQRTGAPFASSLALQVSLMASLAFTNGYVSTLSMMLGPAQPGVCADEAALVGSMMSFFLVLGIFVGSLLALLSSVGM